MPIIIGHDSYSTAADPDYTWTGDLSTGMFHSGSHVFGFSVLGNEVVRMIKHSTGTSMHVGFNGSTPSLSSGTPYQLLVNGKFGATEMYCSLGTPWPDYVFDHKHTLMTFTELRKFLDINKHLPGVPCAADVAADGMNIGQLVPASYEKFEDLYLYILQLEARINDLETKVENKNK